MNIEPIVLVVVVLVAAVICACAIWSVLDDEGGDSHDDFDVHG